MKRIDIQEIIDTAWRRPLSDAEQARVRAWMEGAATLTERQAVAEELEAAHALHALPGVTVPSNFMSQVWAGIEADQRHQKASERKRDRFSWKSWLPRFALGGAVAVAALGVWNQQQASQQKVRMAETWLSSPATPDVADLAMFREFEAIQAMSQSSPSVDIELLGALQ